MKLQRLANIGLRGLTLTSKFLLVFFLAKFLEPRDVGVYGLLASAIGYGIYLVGIEFYTYSSRELMSVSSEHRANILINQLLLYSVFYGVAAIALSLLAATKVLPEKYWIWILALLVLEHFAQEINRVLVALSQQLFASCVLFVRMGLWGVVVIASLWAFPETRTIDFVLIAWLAGVVLACALGIVRVSSLVPSWGGGKIDLIWLIHGLKVALPFFIASVAVRGIATFDRFFVEEFGGLEVVGVYVVFIGMATAVISFIDAGVVDFAYPKLVAAARTLDRGGFSSEMRKAWSRVLGLGASLIVLCALGGHLFVNIVGKGVYLENIEVLYWLLFASAINVMSIVPHLGLYALGYDQAIVRSQVIGFVVFLMLAISLSGSLGIKAVLIAVCAAWATIFVWKAAAYKAALLKFNY